MKRASLLLLCIVAVCLLSIALGYARSTAWWKGPAKALNAAAMQGNQALAPVPLGAFVASDMPVALSGLTIAKGAHGVKDDAGRAEQSEGPAQLRFQVADKGRNNVKSLTFALFDFDERGLLRRVDSWGRTVDLSEEKGPAEITLDLGRRLHPQHRQVLAVEHAKNDNRTWHAQFPGLGRAANKVSNGTPDASAVVDRTEKVLPDDVGSVLCSNGFRKAMLLAQLGDGQSVTSFRCDQNNRSFNFTFSGKDLGQ
jgi:hypothetical protein